MTKIKLTPDQHDVLHHALLHYMNSLSKAGLTKTASWYLTLDLISLTESGPDGNVHAPSLD